MKRNCYMDLRFNPSSSYSPSHNSMNEALNVYKQLVAIPHSKCDVFDVRELQARVIIWLASQEMEESNGGTGPASTLSISLQPRALLIHDPQGFSVKRSLHNFLQRRKKRSQSGRIATHDNSTTK